MKTCSDLFLIRLFLFLLLRLSGAYIEILNRYINDLGMLLSDDYRKQTSFEIQNLCGLLDETPTEHQREKYAPPKKDDFFAEVHNVIVFSICFAASRAPTEMQKRQKGSSSKANWRAQISSNLTDRALRPISLARLPAERSAHPASLALVLSMRPSSS